MKQEFRTIFAQGGNKWKKTRKSEENKAFTLLAEVLPGVFLLEIFRYFHGLFYIFERFWAQLGHSPLIKIQTDHQKASLPFLQTREALPIPVI